MKKSIPLFLIGLGTLGSMQSMLAQNVTSATITTEEDLKKKPAAKKTTARKPSAASKTSMVGKPCPLCGKGTIIKGKTAYGCSNWKEGCQYRLPFDKM